MTIKSVSNNLFVNNIGSDKAKDISGKKENKIQDKLELSEEAKNIQKSNSETGKLDKIKERINSKFYDSDDVINKVAENILKEIDKE